VSVRRRPAAKGVRPSRRPTRVRRRCRICQRRFTLNRRRNPWARGVTCSPACRVALANRGRNASNCRHCDVVESYRLARHADIVENIEIAGGDERPPITFRAFIEGYRYERWDEEAA
jgi:hypothetical protein